MEASFDGNTIIGTPDALYLRLEWKTTPPTKPGWYWATEPDDEQLCQVVNVFEWGGQLVAYKNGVEYELELTYFTHWLGPLPEPKAPGTNAN